MDEIRETAVYECIKCGAEAIGAVTEVVPGTVVEDCVRLGLCPDCNQTRAMRLVREASRVVVGGGEAELEAVDERAGVAVVDAGAGPQEVPMDEVTPA